LTTERKVIVDRRAFLRQAAATCAAGAAPAAWPFAAQAQHHHDAMPAVPQDSERTLVFAAATLKPALDEIVRAYKAAGGAEPNIAFGPTPILAKNIVDGAPADLFFSADGRWMDYLAERSLIRRHTRVDVVRNDVVLAQAGGPGEGHAATIDRAFPIARIVGAGPLAMCNPESHPAGYHGKLALQELGLWDAVAAKVAIVENPQVAVLMVARGDAPAAVVFATDVHGVSGARIAGTFAEQERSPIAYPAAVTMGAPHPEEAQRVLAYLRSPEARQIFDRFGYR
jgi:molybdate transport system substrate-binding protein